MGMTFDTPDADDDLGTNGYGNNIPAIGAHHAMVREVELIDVRNPDAGYKIQYVVLAGPSAGAKITEWLYTSSTDGDEKKEKAIRRKNIGRAMALGLVTEKQLADWKAGRAKLEFDFEDAVDNQCIIVVEPRETTDKQGNTKTVRNLAYAGALALTSPEHQAVPLSWSHAEKIGFTQKMRADIIAKNGGPAADKAKGEGTATAGKSAAKQQAAAAETPAQQAQKKGDKFATL